MTKITGILAIDQGTTSSRAIVFTPDSSVVSSAQQEFTQHYPADGWVEHDPEDIWQTTREVTIKALEQAHDQGITMACVGITNQRETTLVWDKRDGKPIYNAIVWQDRRTAEFCAQLKKEGAESEIQQKTGLLLDPYFSASKIHWILENVEGARQKAEQGHLAFGTVDSYLIWRLTEGQVHATDVTNASRTCLFNIHTLKWDAELLKRFDVPAQILPEVKQCSDDFGLTSEQQIGVSLPITGVAGDQQAATVGQCCFEPGSIKSTYGTGCFVLVNTGNEVKLSKNNLLTTVAYQVNNEVAYALEGSIFIAGAAVQWLRDGIGVIESAKDTESLAMSLNHDHGVYLVPAFAGLGAPHWNPDARASLYGMTRDTGPAHFARVALESVCYQTADLLEAMAKDGVCASQLNVDGGMVANDWLCQFMADIINVEVHRPTIMETTALGAAYLAGIEADIYASLSDIAHHKKIEKVFKPELSEAIRSDLLCNWNKAVQATLHFSNN